MHYFNTSFTRLESLGLLDSSKILDEWMHCSAHVTLFSNRLEQESLCCSNHPLPFEGNKIPKSSHAGSSLKHHVVGTVVDTSTLRHLNY